jgi:hypothetical protein
MSSQRTYEGVSAATFAAVKKASLEEHGTAYRPPDAAQGQAVTQTAVGELVLEYRFDAAASRLSYTIAKKPLLAPEDRIWSGIQSTIDKCKVNA